MSQQDRPASLRRTPRPARDESVDPIDTRPAPTSPVSPQPAPTSPAPSVADEQPAAAAPRIPAAPVTSSTPAPRGRRRGAEPTVPFSNRIALDVDELLHEAVASGRAATVRAAIEEAVRKTWG